MYTYCLFCETVKCDYVVAAAARNLGCRAISPKQIQHIWQAGKPVDLVHDLLPGYVFLYLEDGKLDIRAANSIEGVIRCLRDGDRQYELVGSDERFALMLLRKDGVIGKTQVYQEGQMIRLKEGAFEGIQTKILKVDRQKHRMKIELPFAHQTVQTWVEFEVVASCEPEEDPLDAKAEQAT